MIRNAVYVAPNWKLVWWRFHKHRLAVISAVVVFFIALVAACPGFFSTLDPQEVRGQRVVHPAPAPAFLRRGRLQLYVYAVEGERNPTTLRMEWQTNEDQDPAEAFCDGLSL